MTIWRTVLAGAVLAALWMGPALAMSCGSTDAVMAQLKEKYGEVPTFTGTASGMGAIVITIGPKGSWTVIATPSPGTACLVAAGEDWSASPVAAAPKIEPQALPTPAILPHHMLRI